MFAASKPASFLQERGARHARKAGRAECSNRCKASIISSLSQACSRIHISSSRQASNFVFALCVQSHQARLTSPPPCRQIPPATSHLHSLSRGCGAAPSENQEDELERCSSNAITIGPVPLHRQFYLSSVSCMTKPACVLSYLASNQIRS